MPIENPCQSNAEGAITGSNVDVFEEMNGASIGAAPEIDIVGANAVVPDEMEGTLIVAEANVGAKTLVVAEMNGAETLTPDGESVGAKTLVVLAMNGPSMSCVPLGGTKKRALCTTQPSRSTSRSYDPCRRSASA